MLGAIIGDIVGSQFEFNNWKGGKNFKLFNDLRCDYTDDTICTVAIADAILNKAEDYGRSLHRWCRDYPNPKGGYGARFSQWVHSVDPMPYNSFGNGSAMRVSPVAWAFDDRDKVLEEAEKTAKVSHDHPEGIKGAQAVAYAIWYIRMYGYTPNKYLFNHLSDFYPEWQNMKFQRGLFDETCQGTVPLAFQIIKSSYSFEDAIRNAILWGGDSDTLAAIVGSIAEVIWGIPWDIAQKAVSYLPEDMIDVIKSFQRIYQTRF